MKVLHKDNRGSIIVEFTICGIMFFGFVMGLVVMGLWIYNTSQVKQAARIAALNVAVTDNPSEAYEKAMNYLNKTLVACPYKTAEAYGSQENGYGAVVAEMNPLLPGFQKLIDPRGNFTIDGRIIIRKEAVTAREHRFRPGSKDQYN